MGKRFAYALILVLFCMLGATIRFASSGLPHIVSKYGGSALWAAAVFWLVSTLSPRSPVPKRAAASLLIAFAIEFFKLVRAPALDAFRLTLPGKLLLGRFFSGLDLLAYAAGITLAVLVDLALWTKPAKPVR